MRYGTGVIIALLLSTGLAAAQAPQGTAAAAETAAPQATLTQSVSGRSILQVENASLVEVIDILARQLRINYILDQRLKGAVTVKTYGELREVDPRALLEMILRVNGATMVQVGDIYRIVPMADAVRLPLSPQLETREIPADERVSLNLIFLKYATVSELSKLLEKFVGEGATMITYDAANLLLILDNNRNMRRTMELIALFDSDALARQRVRLFEVKNGSPSDIAKELETVFRSMALGEKSSAVRFIPLERISSVMAVAPNPGVFEEVDQWIKKLDVPVQVVAGSVNNYVYRVKYGEAQVLASSIMQLYLGLYGFAGYGGDYGHYMSMGYGGMGYSPYGPMGGFYPGMSGYGGLGYPAAGALRRQSGAQSPAAQQGATGGAAQSAQTPAAPASPFDMTGYYLGAGFGGYAIPEGMPRVVPNPMDNTLLIQATQQEYEKILRLLRDLDVPPRQVLIEAKIYEVTLTGAFAGGVSAFLQRRGGNDLGAGAPLDKLSTRTAQAAIDSAGGILTAGTLVGRSRELLALLSASEDNRKTKVISAPVVIATDSIPAVINVGQEVPVLSSQALTGAQAGGSSLFANTISNRSSGVTLDITARVNPSGIVTMVINQEVSTPIAPAASAAIQSPSFSTRNVRTQVTVQDGDTIAIGGIIKESDTTSTAGVPFLSRIPVLGMAFGARSTSKERTELVIFMTPRVIYDTNSIAEASEEIKSKLKRLAKIVEE